MTRPCPGGAEIQWSATAGQSGFVGVALQPYVRNWQIFICPSITTYSKTWRWVGYQAASYGYNHMLASGNSQRRLAAFISPAETLCFVDARNPWLDSVGNIYDRMGDGDYNGSTAWHDEGVNVEYLDGHAKWQKLGQIKWNQFVLYSQATNNVEYPRGQAAITAPY